MERMIRKQIYLTPAEAAFVKAQAVGRKLTEADVIREAIEHMESELKATERRAVAWREIEASIQERMKLDVPSEKAWKWNRDELYEERMARYGDARVAEGAAEYRADGE